MTIEKTCPALNEQTFEKMHDRLKTAIEKYAFCLTKTNQSTEDIAQEVLIMLWINWNRFRMMDIDELKGFVFATVRNHIYNEKISNNRRFRKLFNKYLENRSDWCWHDEILFKEGWQLYCEAINRLPKKEREAYAFYESNYRPAQIAAVVDKPVQTVNNQLTSAYKSVREYLNKSFGMNFHGRRQIWKPGSLN